MVVPGSTLVALSIFYTTHSPVRCCHCSPPGRTASMSAANTMTTAAVVVVDSHCRPPPSTAADVVVDHRRQPPSPPPSLLSTAAVDCRCRRHCRLATAALHQAATTLVIKPPLTSGNGRRESTAVSADTRAGEQQRQQQHCRCLWGGN